MKSKMISIPGRTAFGVIVWRVTCRNDHCGTQFCILYLQQGSRRKRGQCITIPTCTSKEEWKFNWHEKTSEGGNSFEGDNTDYHWLPTIGPYVVCH